MSEKHRSASVRYRPKYDDGSDMRATDEISTRPMTDRDGETQAFAKHWRISGFLAKAN